MVKFKFCLSLALFSLCIAGAARAGEPRAAWQVEWEKTLKAAEAEGEVSVYVVDYPRFTVEHFRRAYPKIKLSVVDGPSGPDLSARLMAERRAGYISAGLLY